MNTKQKTPNPFNNQGFSSEAWDLGYKSQNEDKNPYDSAAGDMHQFWADGRLAHLNDIKDIPEGCYCYHGSRAPGDKNYRACPYWSISKDPEKGLVGSCSFLNRTDGESGFDLLWDQVKECGEKDEFDV